MLARADCCTLIEERGLGKHHMTGGYYNTFNRQICIAQHIIVACFLNTSTQAISVIYTESHDIHRDI